MQSLRETLLDRYRYDALDRLIANELSNAPQRRRFYCKSRLTTEIQGVMRYSIVQHGDQLLAQQQSETGAPDTTLLATDQQRSVLQALKAGHPRQPVVYSPYGHHPTANGLLSLLGFNGEQPDPVTGCYLLGNGYRAFNPVLMRFNSPDTLSPFGKGGLNPYAYCSSDPINRRDPTGHAIFGVFDFADSLFETIPKVLLTNPDGYDFAGFHGSSSSHIKSLGDGLNMEFAGTGNGQIFGEGFYATPDIEFAKTYAERTVNKENIAFTKRHPNLQQSSPPTPTIFEVYVKNYPAKKPGPPKEPGLPKEPGVDFTLVPRWGKSIRTQLVFPPEMYQDVLVKPSTSLENPPPPYTAHLDLRGTYRQLKSLRAKRKPRPR